MDFAVTKTIFYLIVPPACLFILMAAGLALVSRRARTGVLLIVTGFIPLYLLSIQPVSEALLKPLETSEPLLKDMQVKADAVVVLGSGTMDLSWLGIPSEPSSQGLQRLVYGVTLLRKLGRSVPLVLMGGNGDPSRTMTADADAMALVARKLGVPAGDLIIENRSRNTLEGAKALGSLITGKRIVLVTSAFHMRRSARMFRKQGFEVIPAPCGYHLQRLKVNAYSFLPRAYSLSVSSLAVSEWLSTAWYSLKREI